MKYAKLLLLMSACYTTMSTNAQLWRQYVDSAKVYVDLKDSEKAINFYNIALQQLKNDSLMTLFYTKINNTVAGLHFDLKKYLDAELLYLESQRILEKIVGKENVDYASNCYYLAYIYFNGKQYVKAENLYKEAIVIWNKLSEKINENYFSAHLNLADLYKKINKKSEAEFYYLESKKIREELTGKRNSNYASICQMIGLFFLDNAEYSKAEEHLIEAKNINEFVSGKESKVYGWDCSILGALYYEMGIYEKAEPLYLAAKIVFEKVLGQENSSYASSCNNLGILYMDMGKYDLAEPLFIEANKIRIKILGKDNPEYASSLNSLAMLYHKVGNYKNAEKLYLECINIIENSMGTDNNWYQYLCNNLGVLYVENGEYKKAETLQLASKKIIENGVGKDHPDYFINCSNLAELYWNMGEFTKAFDLYKEAFYLKYNSMIKIFNFTSEREKLSYLKNVYDQNQTYFSFCLNSHLNLGHAFAYDISLLTRNMILSSTVKLRHAVNHVGNESLNKKFNEWIAVKEKLAYWLSKPKDERKQNDTILEAKADLLEKELSRLSSDFKKENLKQNINSNRIQLALKAEEAAIEFQTFQYYNGKTFTDTFYYVAIIAKKNQPNPELIQLFEKRQLDSLINNKNIISSEKRVNNFYLWKEGNLSNPLYNLIWKPLENKLAGIKTIYFAPAGSLFKISLAAIPTSGNELLSDKFKLIQLNTTESLVDHVATNISVSDKIILYGGVEYDVDSTSMKLTALTPIKNDVASRSLPEDLSRDGLPEFRFLSGTSKEVSYINKLGGQYKYSIKVQEGKNATEESFKLLNGKNSPSVLHIATHGFFFPDPKNIKKDNQTIGYDVYRQSDNPLIRSGLALAGANNAWKGQPVSGVEDGILTSYEVSNMYLPKTKLAVLSACETGLGDIQGSEGVYGLQRAFKLAGVENLVMSLWKVPDLETAEFMQVFYENLFVKQSIEDAFYNTQTMMRKKYRNDPYKWAAWILVQ